MPLMRTLLTRLFLTAAFCLLCFGASQAATFTVNDTGDSSDTNPGDGVCQTTGGVCTFRAAIQETNALFGADTIEFNIAGAGVRTIQPSTYLPDITGRITIDGWSQGGVGYNGPPLIEIDGRGSTGSDGLVITAGNSTVKGLNIHGYELAAQIQLSGGGGNLIVGCYLGTDPTGTSVRQYDFWGGGIGITSANNIVGGNTNPERNLISTAQGIGVGIGGTGATGNLVFGNYIGTDITGEQALGNSTGVQIYNGASGNIIGSTLGGERNVISGNSYGIEIWDAGTSNNQIIGNYIGTDVSGSFELANAVAVRILDGASGNTIGGGGSGEDNLIAYNTKGIVFRDSATTGNGIRRNKIYSNSGLGIDLGDDGVTPNDTDDADPGPNNMQNYPVLDEAINQGGTTTISGTLNSTPNTTFKIEFFTGSSCNSSGSGEGENYLDTINVTTDAGGDIDFVYSPATMLPFGTFVTTTATRNATPHDTSEFSRCVQVVNPLSGIVTNTNDSGPGSLRQAIIDANIIVGIDVIVFDIPGAGVKTINVFTPLPSVTEPVIIDGESQPGFAGTPVIELNGSSAGTGTDGLELSGGGITVKSLIINRFNGDGIDVVSGDNAILGCYIGTNAAGNGGLGNGGHGIRIGNAENNRIGGENATERNIISSNGDAGIRIFGEGSINNTIVGNFIGTDVTGTVDLGNAGNGIDLDSSFNSIIGGSTATSGNLISGNEGSGVKISNGFGNQIGGNKIGTDINGVADLGNTSDGIQFAVNASNNAAGFPLAGNIIAFNADGVNVFATGTGNWIRGNSIFSNSNLGIDLAPNGVTPNDTGDADTGANNLQNFPVITLAAINSTGARIDASLNSTPNTSFTIEFFSGNGCDASGNGEGRTFLGSRTVNTNSAGNAVFVYDAVGTIPLGSFITATASRNTGIRETSEFSECRAVVPGPGNLSFSAATYDVAEGAGNRTITVERLNGNTGTITVDYTTSPGTATADVDYSTTTGTLTFLDGEVFKTFQIPITNDTTDENNETVNLTLSNPSVGVALTPNPTAVLTITDDDNPPTISVADATLAEGNSGSRQFVFDIQLASASISPITVDYATANGTANFDQDYVSTNGQLTFAAGETSKTVSVTVWGDLTVEINETFFVNLSNPVNATILDGQGVGTIADDDNPGRFSFSFAPYSGVENTSVTVTVSRTNGTSGTVAVDYATGGGNAIPFVDYTPVSGNLLFADGETSKTFSVTLLDDSQTEPAESFNVTLSNPVGGTTLGTPSIAPVNILDNDSGTLLSIAGEVRLADNTPVENVTMTLQGAAQATVTTNAFGQYSFTNLAPNGTYSVTPAAIGYTFTPIQRLYSNLTADVTNANFTATAAPLRQLRVAGGNAAPGQNVSVNIELVAQGDENSVGFSMNYDPAVLTNPTAVVGPDATSGFLTVNNSQSGKYGVLLALPTGTSFPAGTRQIVTVTFNTLPTAAYNSAVTFGNVPIARQVVNTNADPLPTIYVDGAVTFAQGYEADLAPRPTGSGNGSVSVADFTQVGRFVAGLDTMNPSFNEFQRADSAPRVSLGNGVLTVSDYTQAGRYAAGVDPVVPAGGQPFASLLAAEPVKTFAAPTAVRIVGATGAVNSQVVVAVETDAQGGENGFGFSVNYDQTRLANPFVSLGGGAAGATLIPNTLQAGRVGVVLAMPIGVGMTAGTKQLVTIRFNVLPGAATGDSPLVLADSPVAREISDVDANVMPATYQNGSVNIIVPTAANESISGRVVTTGGRGIANVIVTATNSAGATRTARTNSFGHYRIDELATGETYVVTVTAKRYRFNEPSRVVSLNEVVVGLDFVANP